MQEFENFPQNARNINIILNSQSVKTRLLSRSQKFYLPNSKDLEMVKFSKYTKVKSLKSLKNLLTLKY